MDLPTAPSERVYTELSGRSKVGTATANTVPNHQSLFLHCVLCMLTSSTTAVRAVGGGDADGRSGPAGGRGEGDSSTGYG